MTVLWPLGDRIVARELDPPAPAPGALWTPDQAPGGTIRAEVIAAGPGRVTDAGVLMPPPAQPGEVVILAGHGPTEIEVDGETFLSAAPNLVLAVDR